MERLLEVVYEDLRRIARKQLRRERQDHTLQPTALIHEAYLRLVDQKQAQWKNRAQFFAIAARQMRRILVDHARKNRAEKRGGDVETLPLDEAIAIPHIEGVGGADIVALDDALAALEVFAPRPARVIDLRFFGGLTIDETAAVLEVSRGTVKLDWNMARAWLFRELRGEPQR